MDKPLEFLLSDAIHTLLGDITPSRSKVLDEDIDVESFKNCIGVFCVFLSYSSSRGRGWGGGGGVLPRPFKAPMTPWSIRWIKEVVLIWKKITNKRKISRSITNNKQNLERYVIFQT